MIVLQPREPKVIYFKRQSGTSPISFLVFKTVVYSKYTEKKTSVREFYHIVLVTSFKFHYSRFDIISLKNYGHRIEQPRTCYPNC